jgi:hypothetical protein
MSTNRHAVIGWNLITLSILIYTGASTMLAGRGEWPRALRRSIAIGLAPALAWSAWGTWVLPHL